MQCSTATTNAFPQLLNSDENILFTLNYGISPQWGIMSGCHSWAFFSFHGRTTLSSSDSEPIWFNPPKFWAATKDMSPQQVDHLMDTVMFLAEIRNLEALRKYDFIGIGTAYLKRNRAAA